MSFKNQLISFFETEKGKKYIREAENGFVQINLDDVREWDEGVVNQLLDFPVKFKVLEEFQEALEFAFQAANTSFSSQSIETGFYGECVPLVKIRDIASLHVGKIIKVRGLVNRISSIRPFYTDVTFRCRECGNLSQPIVQDNPLSLTQPFKKCSCGSRLWDPAFELSQFVDSQEFSIQELHEDISSSAMPKKLPMISFKKFLMNKVICGDLVEIIGVVKLLSVRQKGRITRFTEPYMEVLGIIKKSKDPESIELTADDVEKILELAEKKNCFDILVNSLAPSLYGLTWEKAACLLALFGGVEKKRKDITIRGNLNILLVGDPSTGKSQLLRSVADLAPRGIYATGKGVSAAGLTAAMNKDERTGEWYLEGGVLVLADRGVASIDEIDKMNSNDRINVHEAMEQQTVTISKAGVHAQLNARTAVVAAANPAFGRYDMFKSIQENISGLPPTLLNRFDLIFVLIDVPDEEMDKQILEYVTEIEEGQGETIDRELFRKYIAYAKRICPTVPKSIKKKLADYYLELRKGISLKSGEMEKIPIALRQYEALIRIVEAHARARMKEVADEDDFDFAIKIFNRFLKDVDFDVTGLAGGKGREERKAYIVVWEIITSHPQGISKEDLMREARKKGLSNDECQKSWVRLINEGKIHEDSEGHYRKV